MTRRTVDRGRVVTYLTASEKADVENAARFEGRTVSDFIARLVRQRFPPDGLLRRRKPEAKP